MPFPGPAFGVPDALGLGVRAFVIQELRQDGSALIATPVRFVWTDQNRAMPLKPWEFGITARTKRIDYPGADEPTEQDFGANYKEFTVRGHFDDKYGGRGWAIQMKRALESLVARRATVRVEHEDETFTCVTKNCDFKRHHSAFIEYELTLSPHYRVKGEFRKRVLAPRLLKAPKDFVADVDAAVKTSLERKGVLPLILGQELYVSLSDALEKAQAYVATAADVVNTRVLQTAGDTANSVLRLAQTFTQVGSAAQEALITLENARSDLSLAYETALDVLNFEVGIRGIRHESRVASLKSAEAAAEFKKRATPEAKTLYNPQKNESWYAISNRFYGTPDRWTAIARANHISSMTLTGTELLTIPDQV